MNKTLSLEDFKSLAQNDDTFAEKITGRNDIINLDCGMMTIYSEHINKYLEKYCCKDVTDLEDTLWFSYGVYVRIID